MSTTLSRRITQPRAYIVLAFNSKVVAAAAAHGSDSVTDAVARSTLKHAHPMLNKHMNIRRLRLNLSSDD